MKIAPLMAEYKKHPEIEAIIVHTGQHYGRAMSQLFFDELEIPRPEINLGVRSGSHGVQTAEIMKRFEPVVLKYKPDLVLVVGDVNSTIACALVAAKIGIKVAHVEAGLRSFDREMPEEINRVLTDAISDYLFVTEPSGLVNLKKEGIPNGKVFFVGNVMIDTLKQNVKKADQSTILYKLRVKEKEYTLVTLHRPTNVDDPIVLKRFLDVFKKISYRLPVIFPAHPRTLKNIKTFNFESKMATQPRVSDVPSNVGLQLIKPLGYLDFLRLMASAKVVLTDSGGIQEETTILKVPCLTLRENTERPITVEVGTNILVGTHPDDILKSFDKLMENYNVRSITPDLWDGSAAERIVRILLNSLL